MGTARLLIDGYKLKPLRGSMSPFSFLLSPHLIKDLQLALTIPHTHSSVLHNTYTSSVTSLRWRPDTTSTSQRPPDLSRSLASNLNSNPCTLHATRATPQDTASSPPLRQNDQKVSPPPAVVFTPQHQAIMPEVTTTALLPAPRASTCSTI